MNEIIKKIIDERQTVKAYLPKSIPESDWKQVLEMIRWSPSSQGFEPYRVLVVNNKNQALLQEIKLTMWNQGVVTEASKVVFFIALKRAVFTSDKWISERAERRVREVMGKTGAEAEAMIKKTTDVVNSHWDTNEPNGNEWAIKQSYIALGISLVAATMLDIGSTPMEGFERDKLERVLNAHVLLDPKIETVAVAAAFGYPKDETSYAHRGTKKRVRDSFATKFNEI